MEYQKIINLLKHTPNQSSKFRAKSWVEINDNVCGTNNTNNQIKFKTTILKPTIAINEAKGAGKQPSRENAIQVDQRN